MPRLIVISAPSGSGKTTLARELLKLHPDLVFSVSATTRPRRDGETDGKDYFFISKEEFRRRIADDALVEWEEIYGDYYGSLKSEVDRALAAGRSMVFDVDVKGALSIKKKYPKESLLIFIKPPSIEVLEQRLRERKTEDPETLRRRTERFSMELAQAPAFDAVVINDRLEQAVADVDRIVRNALRHGAEHTV